jgi:hypothetical protein
LLWKLCKHGKLARMVCLRAGSAVGITFGDQP